MGLFLFRSSRQNARFLPVLFSLLLFVFVFQASVVSAESIAPGLSGASAVYTAGEEITIRGETNLAPGTALLITIEAAAFRPTEKGVGEALFGTSGTVVVQDGPPPFWSFTFDTPGWEPGEYLVTIEVPKIGTTESGSFSLLPAEDIPETPASPPPTSSPPDTPVSSLPTPAPSPTAVSLSPAAGLAGFAAVYLFVAYFSQE